MEILITEFSQGSCSFFFLLFLFFLYGATAQRGPRPLESSAFRHLSSADLLQLLHFIILLVSLPTSSDHLPLGTSNWSSLCYVFFHCFLRHSFLLHSYLYLMTHPLESALTAITSYLAGTNIFFSSLS